MTNASIPWVKNPDYDTPGFTVELFCGDKVLVAVPLMKGGYEIHLIVPTETGFDDAAGEMWSEWAWSDVEYYCIARPPLPAPRCRMAVDDPDYLAYPCGVADCPAHGKDGTGETPCRS